MIDTSVLFVGNGLLLMGLSVPLMREQVKPNPFYGLRTRKSLSDSRIWYAANKACGRAFFVAGMATAAAALSTDQSATPQIPWLQLGVMMTSVLAAAVYSLRALARM